DIGGATLLAAFEQERAHFSRGLSLRFDALMNVKLRAIEHERLNGARLRSDAQAPAGIQDVVVPQPLIFARRWRSAGGCRRRLIRILQWSAPDGDFARALGDRSGTALCILAESMIAQSAKERLTSLKDRAFSLLP